MLHKSNKRVGVTLLLVPLLLLLVTSVSAQTCGLDCFKLDPDHRIVELKKLINADSHPTMVNYITGESGWFVISPDDKDKKSGDDEYGLDPHKTLPELPGKKDLFKKIKKKTCPTQCPNYIDGVSTAAVKLDNELGRAGYDIVFHETSPHSKMYTIILKKHTTGKPAKTRRVKLIEIK